MIDTRNSLSWMISAPVKMNLPTVAGGDRSPWADVDRWIYIFLEVAYAAEMLIVTKSERLPVSLLLVYLLLYR